MAQERTSTWAFPIALEGILSLASYSGWGREVHSVYHRIAIVTLLQGPAAASPFPLPLPSFSFGFRPHLLIPGFVFRNHSF